MQRSAGVLGRSPATLSLPLSAAPQPGGAATDRRADTAERPQRTIRGQRAISP